MPSSFFPGITILQKSESDLNVKNRWTSWEDSKHLFKYLWPAVVVSTVQLFLERHASWGSATRTYWMPVLISPFNSTSCGNPWKNTWFLPSSKIKFQIGITVSFSISSSNIGKVTNHLSFTSIFLFSILYFLLLNSFSISLYGMLSDK